MMFSNLSIFMMCLEINITWCVHQSLGIKNGHDSGMCSWDPPGFQGGGADALKDLEVPGPQSLIREEAGQEVEGQVGPVA